jgi:hypothetical protein
MMTNIIHLITSYLNTQKNYLDTKPQISVHSKYTCVTFTYHGINIEVCVYNDTFIKLKVNDMPYAICDSIKTFKHEIDRLHTLRYQW